MTDLFSFETNAYLLAAIGSFLLGIAKSGVKGIAVLIVVLFVYAFGAKASTGILMPLLICGDIFAILYYKKHADWSYVVKLFPWMALGVIFGAYGGGFLDEEAFKLGMAGLILITTILLFYWEQNPQKPLDSSKLFVGITGILAGFTTMIGNLAGAFTNIYFLAIRLPKNTFIGTSAFVFFLINLFKVPFHVWVWGTITPYSIQTSLQFIPYLMVGLLLGVHLVKKINNERYRKLILMLTAIGAVLLFFR